ncbi:MAG TPA: hypothetical protein DER05_02150 [Lutibacter sp.]|nr:hypothetical protein [Lutibacter sp.]
MKFKVIKKNIMKKDLKINTFYIIVGLASFLFSFLAVLALMHLGKISYNYPMTQVVVKDFGNGLKEVREDINRQDYITSFEFITPMGENLILPGGGWRVIDIDYGLGDFHTYRNRLKLYYLATLKEFRYVLIIWAIIFGAVYFFRKFKIKLI